MTVLQHIERLPCLRLLFRVNKRFSFFCRQRLISLKRDIEASICDEIQFVLKLDMPGFDSAVQLKIREIMWGFLKTALGKERVFHKFLLIRKKLNSFSSGIRTSEQTLLRVQLQLTRLGDILKENNPLPDSGLQGPSRSCRKGSDITVMDVDDLHKRIINEALILKREAAGLLAIVKIEKLSVTVERQLLRLEALIDESNVKFQALTDKVAARGKQVNKVGQEDVVLDMHHRIIGQALTLEKEAHDLLVSVKEKLAEAKASNLQSKPLLLKLNRSMRQGLNQLEREMRKCWARLASVGCREWVVGRQAALRRIYAALADRLRMGARTGTKVERLTLGEQEVDCIFAVSFTEELQSY